MNSSIPGQPEHNPRTTRRGRDLRTGRVAGVARPASADGAADSADDADGADGGYGPDETAGYPMRTVAKHAAANRTATPRQRRRLLTFVAGLLIFLTGVAVALITNRPPPLPPGAIPIDAWAPYWTLETTLDTVDQRFDRIRQVSPFWYSVDESLEIVPDPHISTDRAEKFLDDVRLNYTYLIPSIRDSLPAGTMAAILADPAKRAAHIQRIVQFATSMGADGIDIDYEQFAFADGRGTWDATRPNWVAFITELASALHARRLLLAVSIPPVYDAEKNSGDAGYWVYDPGAIAPHVDSMRIMTYDYAVSEVGPIAPLEWVKQSIAGVSAAVGPEHLHKLVLGVPSYGSNWVVSESGTCPASAEGRTNVPARLAHDLATRRQATPEFDEIDGEWRFDYTLVVTEGSQSCTQQRVVRWIDSEGARARAELARYANWGGVSLWALGYEDQEVWDAVVTAAYGPLPGKRP